MLKLSEGEKHILRNQRVMMKWMIALSNDERLNLGMRMSGDIGRTEAVLGMEGVRYDTDS